MQWDSGSSSHMVILACLCFHPLRRICWYYLSQWKGLTVVWENYFESTFRATVFKEILKSRSWVMKTVANSHTYFTKIDLSTRNMNGSIEQKFAGFNQPIHGRHRRAAEFCCNNICFQENWKQVQNVLVSMLLIGAGSQIVDTKIWYCKRSYVVDVCLITFLTTWRIKYLMRKNAD